MMLKRTIYFCTVVSLLFMFQPAHAQQAIDLEPLQGIANVVLLSEDIVGGGAPSQGELEELKRQGFKAVIDLRTVIEGTVFAQGQVEKLGLKYFNIPVFGADVNDEQVSELSKILSDQDNKPVLMHCGSGGRVHALWTRYKQKGHM